MEEALVKRVLPHSVEAEQSVIGAMLMDRDAIIAASETVVADEFYQRQYGVMFETMVELFNEGQPVDLVTLQNRLKEKDVPPEVCSLDAVRDIMATVPTGPCFRTCVSREPLSRTRTWSCSCIGTIIIIKTQIRPMWRRSLLPNSVTALSAP